MVIKAGIRKMLARIANREDLEQQSDLGLLCMPRTFKRPTSVQYF